MGENKNVLTPEGLRLMVKVHNIINKIRPQNVTYNDICYRYCLDLIINFLQVNITQWQSNYWQIELIFPGFQLLMYFLKKSSEDVEGVNVARQVKD